MTDDAKDAARWRWWCRWWFDAKDDMERINDLEYDDEDSLNAAVDVCISEDRDTPLFKSDAEVERAMREINTVRGLPEPTPEQIAEVCEQHRKLFREGKAP